MDPDPNTIEGFFSSISRVLVGDSATEELSLSHYYLQAIYGDWVTAGDNYTIVTSAFAIVNYLAFALGVVIFFAAMIGGVLKTASEGELMGKQFGNQFLAYKMVLGAMLMMPISVDYNVSASQRIAVEILKIGSNAADETWRATVRNATVNMGGFDGSLDFLRVSETIYRATHCAVATAYHSRDKDKHPVFIYEALSTMPTSGRGQGGGIVRSRLNTYWHLPPTGGGLENWMAFAAEAATAIQGQIAQGNITRLGFGYNGSCGVYMFPAFNEFSPGGTAGIENPGERSTGSSTLDTAWHPSKRSEDDEGPINSIRARLRYQYTQRSAPNIAAAIEESIELSARTLIPSQGRPAGSKAMAEARDIGVNHPNFMPMIAEPAELLIRLQNSYAGRQQTLMDSLITGRGDGESSSWQDDIVALAGRRGWLFAGAWIMQLGRITQLPLDMMEATTQVEKRSPQLQCPFSIKGLFKDEGSCPEVQDEHKIPQLLFEYAAAERPPHERQTPACEESEACTDAEVSASISSATAHRLIQALAWAGSLNNSPFTGDRDGQTFIGVDDDAMERAGVTRDPSPYRDITGLANPFAAMIRLGHGMLNVGHVMSLSMLKIKTLQKIANSTGEDAGLIFKSVPFAASALLEWIVTKLLIASSMFVLLGAMLAYVLPVLPMIRWLGPTVGWLVMSAEYVLMAPLAMMLLLIPEGSGIVGTQLNAVIRYLAAGLLRPTLSVLALIVSFVLSFVAFGLYNGVFWMAIDLNTDMSLFEIILVVYLYAFIGYQLLDKIMSLCIYLVRDVLRWLSSGEPFGDATFGGINIDATEFARVVTQPAGRGRS